MKNFATVGRRLRIRKLFAMLLIGASLITCGVCFTNYVQSEPPSRYTQYRTPEGFLETGYIAISHDDPLYQQIAAARMRDTITAGAWAIGLLGAGIFFFLLSRKAPATDIILLAQVRNGLITLPDIATTLSIDPALAVRGLRRLQKLQICSPRWQEYRKNLWEFPDYLHLPVDQALEIAKNAGRVTVKDLMAQGHSPDIARQTLDSLARDGLAPSPPPEAAPAEPIATAQ